jgi:hypothetical protein
VFMPRAEVLILSSFLGQLVSCCARMSLLHPRIDLYAPRIVECGGPLSASASDADLCEYILCDLCDITVGYLLVGSNAFKICPPSPDFGFPAILVQLDRIRKYI